MSESSAHAVPPSSSPLVERLVTSDQVERFASGTQEDFAGAMRALGFASVFDIIREPRESFARKLRSAWPESSQTLAFQAYDNALCYAAQASLVYRRQRLSSGEMPTSGERSGIRSLVDVGPSYPKLFKENWDTFCRSGALEAIDSPVAYLADVLRFAQALETHGNDSKLTLSQRRPDLFAPADNSSVGLLIDQSTTFDPIPALQLANEVVGAKIQHYLETLAAGERPAESIEDWCALRRYPMSFPYVGALEQIRLGLEMPLGQLLYRGQISMAPFSAVKHDPQASGIGYAPIAMADLSRERQALLLEAPKVGTQEEIAAYFSANYGLAVLTEDASELQWVRTFLKQADIDGDALDELLARGKFTPVKSPNVLPTGSAVSPANHGAVFVNNDGSSAPLTLSEPVDANDRSPLQLEATTLQRFIRLNKMLRLRQWFDLPFADLDALVTAAQRAQSPSGASAVTPTTLRVLGAYRYFAKKYGIKADAFAALFDDMAPYSTADKPSLFDRTFNHPPLLDSTFVMDDKPFSDALSGADAVSRRTIFQLCGGLGMSPDERVYGRAATYVKRAAGRELQRSLREISAFHRLARGARLFDLSTGDYMDLLELLGGEEAVSLSARGTLLTKANPVALRYGTSSMACILGSPATPNAATLTGATSATFSVAPALPKGLSLSTSNGTISGTPTEVTAERAYTVTATAAEGSPTASVSLKVAVDDGEMESVVLTGAMKVARSGHAAVLIKKNGKSRVMVIGGNASDGKSVELYDPESGTWVAAAPTTGLRTGHTATVLPSGKVLVVGGNGNAGTAEIYDPDKDTWSEVGRLANSRYRHEAVVLNGKAYVFGGSGPTEGTEGEYFDEGTKVWTKTRPMGYAVKGAKVVVNPKRHKAFVIGGFGGDGAPLDAMYEYDAEKDEWAELAHMPTPRVGHAVFLYEDIQQLTVWGGAESGNLGENVPWISWREGDGGWQEHYPLSAPTMGGTVLPHRLSFSRHLLIGGSSAIQRATSRAGVHEVPISGYLLTPRRNATVTVVDETAGTVLVAGGTGTDGKPLASAELITINPVWDELESHRDQAKSEWHAEPPTGDALDLLMRVDWIVDWLRANKKSVPEFNAIHRTADSESNAATDDMARRIHQGLPATILTAATIESLDLPPIDDGTKPIDWDAILDAFYDRATGLVFEPNVALATPAESVLLETITAALATVNLAADSKKGIAESLTEIIGAARRAQCGLLEAELSHASGLSSDQVTLALIWSGTTPNRMLAPLLVTDTPNLDWLTNLSSFRRHAKALIDAKLSPVALHTFLAKPGWFDGTAVVTLSPSSYYLMHRYRAWLNVMAGSEDDVIRYLADANAGPEGGDVVAYKQRCANRLAPLLGWVADDVLSACATLPAGVATSVSQIEWLLRVGEASEDGGVSVPTALQVNTLNAQSASGDWAAAGLEIQSATRSRRRAGTAATADMDAHLAESKRDALVSLYLTAVVPEDSALVDLGLANRLVTPNDLYEYLLLDTQVSQQVQTSRVASAIASVQQYINGILVGMEPGYATWQPTLEGAEGQVWEVEEWRDQKSQYPLWAANQQLRYFPELYIDPTLRLGKSSYFQDLEQTVNQNRIHIDTVRKAVLQYLGKFEEVANLTIVNGYATSDDFANAMYYFVGKSRGKNKYYWRKVDMSQRPSAVGSAHKGDTLNPSAWSDWELIDLPASEATVERTIRPVFFNERLYVAWVDWYASGLPAGETSTDTGVRPPQVRLNVIYKEYDGSWSAPIVCIDKAVAPAITRDSLHSLAFYDVHALPSKMMVGVYAGANTPVSDPSGHTDAYDMMRNARLDHNFNVEPAWPENGKVVTASGGVALGEDERYVRIASHQLSIYRGQRYIQFPISGTAVRLRNVSDFSSSPWLGEHNSAIEGIGSASRVRYESEVVNGETQGYIIVTARLKDAVSSYAIHRAKWTFTVPKASMEVEVTYGDNYVLEEPSRIRINWPEFEIAYLPRFPAFPQEEATWTSVHMSVSGYFEAVNAWHSIVGKHVYIDDGHSSYGSAMIRDVGGLVFHDRPALDYSYGLKKTYRFSLLYAPGSLISSSASPRLVEISTTPSSATPSLPVGTEVVIKIAMGDGLFPIESDWLQTLDGGFQIAYGLIEYDGDGTALQGYDLKYSTIYLEDYKQTTRIAPSLGGQLDSSLGTAEFIDFRGSSIANSDGSSTHARPAIRMNTLFAKDLISRTNIALENLLSWDTQSLAEPAIPNAPSPFLMDFKGANGKYFWELFFHLPFSIAHRFHTEQQFADSDRWLQFIFDPSYKGDPVGEDLPASVRRPYWQVRPLDPVNDPLPELSQALRAPIDPDGQASAFPVHYRKAVYFLFIRNIMLRGDWAFRDLTPDSLNEAKLWYVRALDLLGPRPDALLSDRWKPTPLEDIVTSTNEPLRALTETMGDPALADVPSWNRTLVPLQAQTFRRDTFLQADDTDPALFRVPFNDRLVELWDQLESRLHNLRNNLTIDGKPLQLPIFAAPLDPSALLASFAAGGTARSAGRLGLTVVPHYRYTTMFMRASAAVETLIQFGQTLLSYVERQDQAELTELQQGQLWEISQFAIDLQLQMQDVELANEDMLLASKQVAENRKAYYEDRLEDGGVSSEEVAAGALHMAGRAMEGGAAAAFLAAYCLKAIPNVFGFSNGGQDVEGPPEGVGKAIIGAASIAHGVAEALDRAAQYKRRNEEWTLQRDQAGLEIAQIDEQIKVLAKQKLTTTTQLRQAERARAQAEQMYTFLSKRFTHSSLYGWLVSQLSGFYYQAYDATISLCLAAEACWQFEIGDFSVRFIEPGKWKDAYRGLTVGEGLKLNLLKMDSAYVNRHERYLVIGKTISLKALYEKKYQTEWGARWADDIEKGVLTFGLDNALFNADYDNHTLRRIRRVGVSIPAVVGAYQDIRAVLTQTSNQIELLNGEPKYNVRPSQQIVVSRGIDDDGMMMDPQMQDDRYLPFEGTGAISDWTLTFPNATTEEQQAILTSLNDVIVHLTYTARVSGSAARVALRPPEGRLGR